MNRRNVMMLAMASALMLTASCSQEMDELNAGGTPGENIGSEVRLQFATAPATRGTMYDETDVMPEDSRFSVYGYSCKDGFDKMGNTPNFIDNGEATKAGTVTVDGAAQHYNSSEPYVQLVGAFPYLTGANSLEKTGVDTYKLTYDIGANDDASLHKDLMLGKTDIKFNKQTQQPAATINLHHALTGINFAIGDYCPTGYHIVGIEMQGLAAKGTCQVTFNGDTPNFDWTPSETKENIHLKFPEPVITTQMNRTVITGTKTDGRRDNLTIFMVPQQLGSDAKAIVWLKKDEKSYRGRTPSPYNDTDYRKAYKKLTINLNAAKSWQSGKAVIYRIDEEKTEQDLRYKFKNNNVQNRQGDDGLTEFYFLLSSYRYSYYGSLAGGKRFQDVFCAIQTFEITKYEYEDATGTHETDKQPDWLIMSFNQNESINGPRTGFNISLKIDNTKPSYPEGIKQLTITLKQDASDMELTVPITGLPPKASK